jgi:hypothetical protein
MGALTCPHVSATTFRLGINLWPPFGATVAETLHIQRKRDSDRLPGK